MKTVAAVLVTAAITAGGGYAAGDRWATQQQVNDLSQRVTKLEKANRALLIYVGTCFVAWAPVSRYGDTTQGYGYYPAAGDPFTTSALDITQDGDTAGFYVPASSADCSLTTARLLARRHTASVVVRRSEAKRSHLGG